MYSIVLFDLGDVLASYDPRPRIAAYARAADLEEAEVRARLRRGGFGDDCDRGVYSAEQMHREICQRLEHAFSREELLSLEAAAFRVQSEVLAIASTVASRVRTGILTNNGPLLEETFPVHFPELVAALEPILISYQFNHMKADRGLFDAVSTSIGINPGEILFIDDKALHVSLARDSGWQAEQFVSASQLRGALVARGLIEDAA